LSVKSITIQHSRNKGFVLRVTLNCWL